MDYSKNLPPSGAKVRLTRLPVGSYATVGEVYTVTYRPHVRGGRKGIHSTTSIYLAGKRGGTFDSAMMWAVRGREAQWEIAQ